MNPDLQVKIDQLQVKIDQAVDGVRRLIADAYKASEVATARGDQWQAVADQQRQRIDALERELRGAQRLREACELNLAHLPWEVRQALEQMGVAVASDPDRLAITRRRRQEGRCVRCGADATYATVCRTWPGASDDPRGRE